MKRPGGRVVSAPASDQEVLGSNPAGGGIQLLIVRRVIVQRLSLLSFQSSLYGLYNVIKGVKPFHHEQTV